MNGVKLAAHSSILGRLFHVDGFRSAKTPDVFVLMFGGSGITEAEYSTRAASAVPVFDTALASLERERHFAFAFVTAPFDIHFAGFATEPEARLRWNRHCLEELIPLCCDRLGLTPDIPRYLIGYSGGAALALAGHHREHGVIGAGALGADGLDGDAQLGPDFREPVSLYYGSNDSIRFSNSSAISRMRESGVAELFVHGNGGHDLASYIRGELFGGLVRRAFRLSSRKVKSR